MLKQKSSCMALQLQSRLQQQAEQLRLELEASHQRSSQQLQNRLAQLESSCRELTDRRYQNEALIRDLKVRLMAAEEVHPLKNSWAQCTGADSGSVDVMLRNI